MSAPKPKFDNKTLSDVMKARQSLFEKIHKLSNLIEEIKKRQEADAYILEDPIADMVIEISPQLLKYAHAQPSLHNDLQFDDNDQEEIVRIETKIQKSPSKNFNSKRESIAQPSSAQKSKKTKTYPPPVVERLYNAKAKAERDLEKLREEKLQSEKQFLKTPEFYPDQIPLHMRVDQVLNKKKKLLEDRKSQIEFEKREKLAAKGIKTDEEILQEQQQKDAEKRLRLQLTNADFEKKYQQAVQQKRYKQMQAEVTKATLEQAYCTFKPEINRQKNQDSSDESIHKKRKLSESPENIIPIPVSGRIEDRLIEKGMKTKEKVSAQQRTPQGSFKPMLNVKSMQMMTTKRTVSKSPSGLIQSAQKPAQMQQLFDFPQGSQTQRVQLRQNMYAEKLAQSAQKQKLPDDLLRIMNALERV